MAAWVIPTVTWWNSGTGQVYYNGYPKGVLTFTPTSTFTITPTNTNTLTITPTPTNTSAPTNTFTPTPTSSPLCFGGAVTMIGDSTNVVDARIKTTSHVVFSANTYCDGEGCGPNTYMASRPAPDFYAFPYNGGVTINNSLNLGGASATVYGSYLVCN